ncbi:hypothetical protein ACFL6N_02415 [Thermodesulfobacteriota bacterium]
MKKHINCQSCGLGILPGGSFYVCRTEIVAGHDGYLPDQDEQVDRIFSHALEKISAQTEHEVMEDVYQEIKLILCPICRQKFRNLVLSMFSRP